MGSMRPEALFLSSSTSRYGSAQVSAPQKVSSGDAEAWHRWEGGR